MAVKKDGRRIVCARCSGLLNPKTTEPSEPPPAPASAILKAPPAIEDTGLDADLAAVTRVMRSLRIDAPASAPVATPAYNAALQPHLSPRAPAAATSPAKSKPQRTSGFAWLALMLGMMAFTCGAVLLGWSFVTGRGDLWTYGLPAVLAGQGLLVLGLVLQLEGLWQSNRDTRETLADLDRELHELRHATAILSTTHSAPGQSFYAHMAEGASPHLLLADVKGQLDVIAMRLAEAKRP